MDYQRYFTKKKEDPYGMSLSNWRLANGVAGYNSNKTVSSNTFGSNKNGRVENKWVDQVKERNFRYNSYY